MKRVEDSIQRNLVAWIKKEYPHVKVIGTLNEDSRTKVAMGVDVGLPDLMIMWSDDDVLQVYFLELKTKDGRLKKSQKDWAKDYHERFASSNTHYGVAYGFREAIKQIEGVLKCEKSK